MVASRGLEQHTDTEPDVASTCTIEDISVWYLPIESKAHDSKLIKEETGRKNIDAPVSGNARRNVSLAGLDELQRPFVELAKII